MRSISRSSDEYERSGISSDRILRPAAYLSDERPIWALFDSGGRSGTDTRQDLAQIPDGKAKNDGITVGQTVAAQVLTFRANDRSGAPQPGFTSKNIPGFYRATPPDFAPADFTQWGDVVPFAIVSAHEFLPEPPPALTDKEYIRDLAEVQSIGESDSTTRTPEQTVIGTFWGGKIQNYWNEITQTAAMAHNLNLEQSARLFALVNFGMADATISFFEAKYIYHFWRPVTPAELTDSDWMPLSTKTAPDPSYPGAHSATTVPRQQCWRFISETNSPSMSHSRYCLPSPALY